MDSRPYHHSTVSSYLLFALALLLGSMHLSACAPKTQDPKDRPQPALTRDKPFGPSMTFEELLNESIKQQYSDISSIFTLPQDPARQEMFLISREKPRLILARGVTAYAGGSNFLATGYSNGNIRIWSRWPCSLVTLPAQEAVSNLWWNNSIPYISASGANRSRVSVYDLRQCARGADIKAASTVLQFAVSPQGDHVACVDQGRRLWSGTFDGLIEQQATLRYDPLAMAFSPKAGLLMAADRSGWLILWTLPDYQVLDQTLIPGGPFARANFDRHRLIFHPEKGPSALTVWDIPGSRPVEKETEQGRFVLEDNVLYFILSDKRWIKKALLSPPRLQVEGDPEKGIIQLLDLDKQSRYYLARTGEQIHKPPDDLDPVAVDVAQTGEFSWGQAKYQLADPVLVKADWALWSRHIPGQGHYLWWAPHQGLAPQEFESQLPIRKNIRAEIPPEWMDCEINE